MSNHTPNPNKKRCCRGDKCVHSDGPILYATSEFFGLDKTRQDGLYPMCRECSKHHAKTYRIKHPDAVHASQKKKREANKFAISAWKKDWYKRNSKAISENRCAYYQVHRDKLKGNARRRYYRDLDRSREQSRKNYIRNQPKYRVYQKRRDAHKRVLPATFTNRDWLHALDYFHGACAYCGNPPSLFDRRPILCQDHFIPLVKDGAYTADNIIPACYSCNGKKNDTDPIKWINQRFGKRKAKQILSRIQAYFDSLKGDAN